MALVKLKKRGQLKEVPAKKTDIKVAQFNIKLGAGFLCSICGKKHQKAESQAVNKCFYLFRDELEADRSGILLKNKIYFGGTDLFYDPLYNMRQSFSVFCDILRTTELKDKEDVGALEIEKFRADTSEDDLRAALCIPETTKRAEEVVRLVKTRYAKEIEKADRDAEINKKWLKERVSKIKRVKLSTKSGYYRFAINDKFFDTDFIDMFSFRSRATVLLKYKWIQKEQRLYFLARPNNLPDENISVLFRFEPDRSYFPIIVPYATRIYDAINMCRERWMENS